MTTLRQLRKKYPQPKYAWHWNGYRYGSSGHWHIDNWPLRKLASRVRWYFGLGGNTVRVDIWEWGVEPTTVLARITFDRWEKKPKIEEF